MWGFFCSLFCFVYGRGKSVGKDISLMRCDCQHTCADLCCVSFLSNYVAFYVCVRLFYCWLSWWSYGCSHTARYAYMFQTDIIHYICMLSTLFLWRTAHTPHIPTRKSDRCECDFRVFVWLWDIFCCRCCCCCGCCSCCFLGASLCRQTQKSFARHQPMHQHKVNRDERARNGNHSIAFKSTHKPRPKHTRTFCILCVMLNNWIECVEPYDKCAANEHYINSNEWKPNNP